MEFGWKDLRNLNVGKRILLIVVNVCQVINDYTYMKKC